MAQLRWRHCRWAPHYYAIIGHVIRLLILRHAIITYWLLHYLLSAIELSLSLHYIIIGWWLLHYATQPRASRVKTLGPSAGLVIKSLHIVIYMFGYAADIYAYCLLIY